MNFAIIEKIQGTAKIQIFAMHSNFRYHREKSVHREISQGLQKFFYGCEIFAMHREKPCTLLHPPAFTSASISSIPLDISLTRLDEIAKNSYEHGINRHQLEAKLEMMAEAHKTYKITKNKLETKSVVLNGSAHVNWLNSYD